MPNNQRKGAAEGPSDRPEDSEPCVVIGAGPAGLTAAYELSKLGRRAVVLEADDIVGGLARTCEYKGYRFDVGGHRFFTKVSYVEELWREILGDELLVRPRLSRIHYRGKLFDYPLKPLNALRGLGVVESVFVVLSYLRALVLPFRRESTFEHWVRNRFGKRLFEVFFKTYTEKVWGIPCSEIGAEWASQRIKDLDLVVALRNALLGAARSKDGEVVTSLIEEFLYPRHGPGQMWTRCASLVEKAGGDVRLESPVVRLHHREGRIVDVVVRRPDGTEETVSGEQFLSSMPIGELALKLDPPPPEEVRKAARTLRYRDFITVALIVDRDELFTDNWIYIHSPTVRVGRIQNYKNWSPDMVADDTRTALGLEYFVQEGDELWTAPDEELVALGRREIVELGLASEGEITDGTVLRMKKAYPVYDGAYKSALRTLCTWMYDFENLQQIGRNGQHRYNNQDHAMMTGVLAARNVVGAEHDIWAVNVERDYHEQLREPAQRPAAEAAAGERLVPRRVGALSLERQLARAFGRYDPLALGGALGIIAGAVLWLATALIVVFTPQGQPVGPNLSLLGNYFLGYSASWGGAFVGLAEAAVGGFVGGWLLAQVINRLTAAELRRLLRRIERRSALGVLEGEHA
jgi:protoporphyrinogen oxidase